MKENELNILAYDDEKINDIIEGIGKSIRTEREKRCITTSELCDRANMGESQLYKIESGISHIGITSLIKVSLGLNISTDLLIPTVTEDQVNIRNMRLIEQMIKEVNPCRAVELMKQIELWKNNIM